MVTKSDNAALVQLDDHYQQICANFADNLISAENARAQVHSLTHTDEAGGTWSIDTKRSGRNARFIYEIDNQTGPTHLPKHLQTDDNSSSTTHFALVRLDDHYQQICANFADNLISAENARAQVHSLTHTDEAGGTWSIDTKRSGRNARFIYEIDNQTAPLKEFTRPASSSVRSTEITTSETEAHPFESELSPDEYLPRQTPASPTRREIDDIYKVRRLSSAIAIFSTVVAILLVLNLGNKTKADPLINFGVLDTNTNSGANSAQNSSPPGGNSDSAPTRRENTPFNINIEFGRSVLDEPLIVRRRGANEGVRILIVGVIHGSERFGRDIVNVLDGTELGTDFDLWLVPTMNPDGEAKSNSDAAGKIEFKASRRNANGVDLNRNFPGDWDRLGEPGYWEYGGASAGSEPEVQAMMRLINFVKPQIVIWYHADYFRVAPAAGREGLIRKRYANLAGLPLLPIEGGTYTGTATSWTKTALPKDGVTFVVEFGKTFSSGDATANANAVLTVAREFFQKP